MLGYAHEAFWDQTPHTLSLTFEAANKRLIREHNDRAWLAWHTAGIGRSKTMPPLRSLLAKEAPQQTLEQQLKGLENFVRATGGKVIRK